MKKFLTIYLFLSAVACLAGEPMLAPDCRTELLPRFETLSGLDAQKRFLKPIRETVFPGSKLQGTPSWEPIHTWQELDEPTRDHQIANRIAGIEQDLSSDFSPIISVGYDEISAIDNLRLLPSGYDHFDPCFCRVKRASSYDGGTHRLRSMRD